MATWERARLSFGRQPPPVQEQLPELRRGVRVREVLIIAVLVVSTSLWVASALTRQARETATPRPDPPRDAATSATTAQPVTARPAGFVVTFGEFSHQDTARRQARLVRSKGYLATVSRSGPSLRVISRIYDDRHQAEFWAAIFHEIGIPATPVSVSRLGQTTAD